MGKAAHGMDRCRGRARGIVAALGALTLAATLSACGGGLGDALGFGKSAPDEFAVVRSAPLTIPPDFKLRPPQPGAPRPNEASVREQAEDVLLQEAGTGSLDAATTPASQGEAAFIERAGATGIDPDIRRIVDREFSGYASEDESFVDSLIFWREDQPAGEVVDAAAEAERLRENIEEGKPVTAGETPTIKRRKKALLEDLF